MTDKTIHIIALCLISTTIIGKAISLVLTGDLHENLFILESISISSYFIYIGFLGWATKHGAKNISKFVIIATIIVVLDLIVYFLINGWSYF